MAVVRRWGRDDPEGDLVRRWLQCPCPDHLAETGTDAKCLANSHQRLVDRPLKDRFAGSRRYDGDAVSSEAGEARRSLLEVEVVLPTQLKDDLVLAAQERKPPKSSSSRIDGAAR